MLIVWLFACEVMVNVRNMVSDYGWMCMESKLRGENVRFVAVVRMFRWDERSVDVQGFKAGRGSGVCVGACLFAYDVHRCG